MHSARTKSLDSIEQKMQDIDQNSLRYHILQNAKDFKTSWIELGRALYTVSKDKLYKEWGYSSFDIYTSREIGIRKQTAMKLLRSYYFLEKEEPFYLKKEYMEESGAANVPGYESVDVLRQAKNKKVGGEEYAALKKEIFEKGKDACEVKKELTAMIRQRQELDPEEARRNKKLAIVKRLLSTLKSLKEEAGILKLLPAPLIKETDILINKLEAEIKE